MGNFEPRAGPWWLAASLVPALIVACGGGSRGGGVHLEDLDGRRVDPFPAAPARAVVFVFTRTDCPISNRYAPEVARLYKRFGPRGVDFWLVYPDRDETAQSIRAHLKEYGYPIDALRDPEQELVALTGARVSPEAAVFVDRTHLAYRGRIDDRFVDFGKARAEPTRRDLEEALEAVLARRPVVNPRTTAVGCYLSDLE
jgi:hypothetical protein